MNYFCDYVWEIILTFTVVRTFDLNNNGTNKYYRETGRYFSKSQDPGIFPGLHFDQGADTRPKACLVNMICAVV